MIFSGQSTEDTMPDMETGTKQYAYFVCVQYYQNLLKGRILRNRKQNKRRHRIRMRENGGSLDFNFISLLNPVVDENWVPASSAAVLPLKMMPCTMFRSIQTFSVNGKFTERYQNILCTDRPSFYYFRLLTL